MSNNFQARSAARLWAVSALYQMEMTKAPLEDIIEEFTHHRLDEVLEDMPLTDPDIEYFRLILRGIIENQKQIDKRINMQLSEKKKLPQLDTILRAILRAGCWEVLFCEEVPAKVVICEYTDMANAFFDGPQIGLTNAVLEGIAE